jgi:hypothetical protein
VAVLVRDPSATTPVDVSLNNNRRALYLSQPASESHHLCHGKPGHGKPGRTAGTPLPIADSGPRTRPAAHGERSPPQPR